MGITKGEKQQLGAQAGHTYANLVWGKPVGYTDVGSKGPAATKTWPQKQQDQSQWQNSEEDMCLLRERTVEVVYGLSLYPSADWQSVIE